MDVLDLMETKLSSFTKTDRAVYERLRKYPEEFAHDSYDRLTSILDVSPSALTRFAKKLGFAGYAELQYQLAIDLEERAQRKSSETTAQVFGSFLEETERNVDEGQLNNLAKRILAAHKVYCVGFNLSNLSARYLWTSLVAQLSVDAVNDDFDYVERRYGNDDVIILFSVASGEWYRPILQRLRKYENAEQPYIVLVTMNSKHSLRRYCDELVVLPTAGKVSRTHTAALELMIFTMFSDMLICAAHRQSK